MVSTPTQDDAEALLIGINRYPKCLRDLLGCENDARLFQKVLIERFGFSADKIQLLLNGDATQYAIREQLNALVKRVRKDAQVVLYYAGHGSRMRAREGSKASGWDETLVPHDSGRIGLPNRDISDDEIREWLLLLAEKTRNVTLIFDCCYSATLHRDGFAAHERGLPADERSFTERPPSPFHRPSQRAVQAESPGQWLPPGDHYVVMSACRDSETAKETARNSGSGLIWYGTFTYHLVTELNRLPPGATYRNLLERVAQLVTCEYSTQHPSAEGALDRVLFANRARPMQPYVLVSDVAEQDITLDGGHIHGAEVGSIWEILREEGDDMAAADAAQELQIISAEATRAIGRLTMPGSVKQWSHAVLRSRPLELKWPINVVAAEKAELAALTMLTDTLGRSSWLRLARSDDVPRARIYLLQPRTAASPDSPLPQCSNIAAPCWAVVGRDGEPLMRRYPTADATLVANNLEALARHAMLYEMRNPDSGLIDQIDFLIEAQNDQGAFIPICRKPSDLPTVKDGTRIAFQLINRHAQPLYFTLLMLDANGAIEQIFPPAEGQEALAPNQPFFLGREDKRGPLFRVRLPRDRSFMQRWDGTIPDEVQDSFKLLLSTQPINCRPLLQKPMRGERPILPMGESTLDRLLQLIFAGQLKVRSLEIEHVAQKDWNAQTHSIRIVP